MKKINTKVGLTPSNSGNTSKAGFNKLKE